MTTTSRHIQTGTSPEMIFERWVDKPFASKRHNDINTIPLDTTASLDNENETTEVKIYRRNSALALNSLNAALSRKSC